VAEYPSRLRTMLWAVGLPALTALVACIAAADSWEDTRYTNAMALTLYAVLMPAVALRNARALRAPGVD
jgi:hypothetical protein